MIKNQSAIWETQVQSLGQEDSPGEGNGNPFQYSCLGNPWTEEPSGLPSMGSQRDMTEHAYMHARAEVRGAVFFCSVHSFSYSFILTT